LAVSTSGQLPEDGKVSPKREAQFNFGFGFINLTKEANYYNFGYYPSSCFK
jgi:hypothetical protein